LEDGNLLLYNINFVKLSCPRQCFHAKYTNRGGNIKWMKLRLTRRNFISLSPIFSFPTLHECMCYFCLQLPIPTTLHACAPKTEIMIKIKSKCKLWFSMSVNTFLDRWMCGLYIHNITCLLKWFLIGLREWHRVVISWR
jgi:hypothetical protein